MVLNEFLISMLAVFSKSNLMPTHFQSLPFLLEGFLHVWRGPRSSRHLLHHFTLVCFVIFTFYNVTCHYIIHCTYYVITSYIVHITSLHCTLYILRHCIVHCTYYVTALYIVHITSRHCTLYILCHYIVHVTSLNCTLHILRHYIVLITSLHYKGSVRVLQAPHKN